MEIKKRYYVANIINKDVKPVIAYTWWEAMDKAFAMWNCTISRHDMFEYKPKKQPSWQNHFSF